MVLAAMKSKGHTNRFKAFCKSETMDAFLHACIDYFLLFFKLIEEKDKAKNSAERRDALAEGKAPPAEGGSPSDAAPPPLANAPSTREIAELENEQRARLRHVPAAGDDQTLARAVNAGASQGPDSADLVIFKRQAGHCTCHARMALLASAQRRLCTIYARLRWR